ncbi:MULTISPECIES: hypothetical protein [unclassified Streptomyces]|uniref:hypothetical protein n=1 Tax=unclassified Streptomyces TaxID=2593676 RepID=UPI000DBAB15E|nr:MULTISPECIES: hypothetical protein [unclassified Streptomyces]MYT69026.1 hypothetical protein [Streptomyces sp. SID8367]RAJ82534.1 hypothetical protein K377_04254 [Streptomyces sp. PsTaAH-137]
MANTQDNGETAAPTAGTAQPAAAKAAEKTAGKFAAKAEAAGAGAGRVARAVGTEGAHAATTATAALDGARSTVTSAAGQAASAATAAAGQAASAASTAWAALKDHKVVAAGVTAGATALVVGSYAAGRRAERGAQGPLTRLTGGRV